MLHNAIDNAHSIIGGKISYLRDKLNVKFYEVGLHESLKKMDVLLHRISIQIYNLKNLSSICSGNSTIDYLDIDEINYMICHICTE